MEEGSATVEHSGEPFYTMEGTPLEKGITSGDTPSVEGLNNQIEAMINSASVQRHRAPSESAGSQHPLTSVLPTLQQQLVSAGVLSEAYPLQLTNQQIVNNGVATSVASLLQLSVALPINQQIVSLATPQSILQLPTSLLTAQETDNSGIQQSGSSILQSVTTTSANQMTGKSISVASSATNPPVPSSTATSATASQPQAVNTNITTSGSNPLQVSVKTNSSVNRTLLSNIVNSQAVQNLLRDNPGQPITIVRMPQAVQQVPKLSFPVAPISSMNFKALRAQKRNGTPQSTRGRKPRKIRTPEFQEDKSKLVEVQKSLQITTRSGRVSKPPMYRVKQTLDTPISGQGQQDKMEINTPKENVSVEKSPLEATGQPTTDNLRSLPQSGRGLRGFRSFSRGRRRGRGRIGNLGNRDSLVKLKKLLIDVSDEDFISLVAPKLCELLSPWDFMLMRAFRKKKTEPDRTSVDIRMILGEFQELLTNMKKLSRECLVTDRVTESPQSVLDVPIPLHEALGMRGTFYVKEMPKELLTSRVIGLIRQPSAPADSVVTQDNPGEQTAPPLAITGRRTEDGIMGLETIFPEDALRMGTPAKTVPSIPNPPTPMSVQPEACDEVTGMIVNVEEIETTGVHPNEDVNLNQTVHESAVDLPTVDGAEESLIRVLPDGETGRTMPDNHGPIDVGNSLPSTQVLHDGNSLSKDQTLDESNPLSETPALSVGTPLSNTQTLIDTLPDARTLHGTNSDSQLLQGGSTLTDETDNLHQPALPGQHTDAVYDQPIEAETAVIEDMVPSPLQHTTSPMVPVGSTIMQMTDGNFLVQKPDGTAMQIHAPEGMTIETIQALLSLGTEVSAQPEQTENTVVDDQDFLTVNEATG